MYRHMSIAWTTACLLMAGLGGSADAMEASDIARAAGFHGGVVVQIGCADGVVIAKMPTDQRGVVQVLDTDPANVRAARRWISQHELDGRVTARPITGGHLPFVDNMVNLVVATQNPCTVPVDEIARVLAPRGVLLARAAALPGVNTAGLTRQAAPGPDGWIKMTKPVPAGMDDWTHYQYDATGIMVGQDTLVGPPRNIQWMGGPKWLRNHDFMSSMNAMVSCGGKIFYVIDEGLRKHILLPSKWVLVARDGFNGTILWKRPLKQWYPHNWPLKSGPGDLPRRLVAVGDRVYLTEGFLEPVTAVDAMTGKTVHVYADTKPTDEILVADGVLFALADPRREPVDYRAETTSYREIGRANSRWAWTPDRPARRIMAIDARSGKVLWQHTDRVAPLTLAVNASTVFFHNGAGLVALDRSTGKVKWTTDGPAVKSVPTGGSLRVVFIDGVVAFAQGTRLTVVDAEDGHRLWNNTLLHTSHHCPEDLFVIDGSIWSPNTGRAQEKGTHYKVMDLHTGDVTRDFVATNLPGFPMHPRCYPSRATTKYIMTNGMGTEFYRVGGTTVDINNTVRGSCIYGVMPCNGLLYKPADSCACYYQSKLEHFCALAPEQETAVPSVPADARLEKGPVYGKIAKIEDGSAADAWPAFRHDAARSGCSPAALKPKLKPSWHVELGGKLTQPVIANGRVFVSAIDRHTLYVLDAKSGHEAWRFTAGGRVDSAPTIYRGTVVFGCADGWVYCLRAGDGQLVWRYFVAPDARQMLSYQQLESVWPLHGAVLIEHDTIYALAGRNMFFNGGMRLVRLDPATGSKLSETVLDDKDPNTGRNLQTLIAAKYMPIADEDVLSSDGRRVYMREQNFDLNGKRITIANTVFGRAGAARREGRHLFCQTGLLDDMWFHRSYWIYGSDCGEGWGAYAKTRPTTPCGRLLAFDDARVYGYISQPLGNMLLPRQTYSLYAAEKNPSVLEAAPKKRRGRKGKVTTSGPVGRYKIHWQKDGLPLLVNAMVVAGKHLIVAGPPDLADETKMLGYRPGARDALNQQLQAQDAAWRGARGGILQVRSTETGAQIGAYKLDSFPRFDGMSVAEGKLFMSLVNGTVSCYAGHFD